MLGASETQDSESELSKTTVALETTSWKKYLRIF